MHLPPAWIQFLWMEALDIMQVAFLIGTCNPISAFHKFSMRIDVNQLRSKVTADKRRHIANGCNLPSERTLPDMERSLSTLNLHCTLKLRAVRSFSLHSGRNGIVFWALTMGWTRLLRVRMHFNAKCIGSRENALLYPRLSRCFFATETCTKGSVDLK